MHKRVRLNGLRARVWWCQWSRAHGAGAWGRCADDPPTLQCLTACRIGQGRFVNEAPRRKIEQ
jgi:hypothetical protein